MSLAPVSLTKRAVEEIKTILSNKGIPDNYSLRIGIKGGGCGSIRYTLGFDESNSLDISYLASSISIIVEKKHVMYLIGLEVDFVDTAVDRGFVFSKHEKT